jgi:hypothetical protein
MCIDGMCPVNNCDLKLNLFCKELNIALLVLVFLILFIFHVDRKYFLEITHIKWMKKLGT